MSLCFGAACFAVLPLHSKTGNRRSGPVALSLRCPNKKNATPPKAASPTATYPPHQNPPGRLVTAFVAAPVPLLICMGRKFFPRHFTSVAIGQDTLEALLHPILLSFSMRSQWRKIGPQRWSSRQADCHRARLNPGFRGCETAPDLAGLWLFLVLFGHFPELDFRCSGNTTVAALFDFAFQRQVLTT